MRWLEMPYSWAFHGMVMHNIKASREYPKFSYQFYN